MPRALLFPYFKFGFANIVILVLIYNYRFNECVLAILFKNAVGRIYFGSRLFQFHPQLFGSMLSFWECGRLKMLPGEKT